MNVFSCKRCGHCCTGSGGIVLDQADLNRLCSGLKQTASEFLSSSTQKRNGKLQLLSKAGACIFFGDKGCEVHEWRPNVCRAWPYFYGNLVDEVSLMLAKQDCPGINAKVSHAEFKSTGIKYMQQHQLNSTHATALRPLPNLESI